MKFEHIKYSGGAKSKIKLHTKTILFFITHSVNNTLSKSTMYFFTCLSFFLLPKKLSPPRFSWALSRHFQSDFLLFRKNDRLLLFHLCIVLKVRRSEGNRRGDVSNFPGL